jgi:hypothetical protein
MFMCRFLEVHPTRPEFINASCNKNRRTYVALYLENEYDEVVVEACFDYKRLDNPICNWPSFQSKFYKVCMKDNNIFPYQKMMN